MNVNRRMRRMLAALELSANYAIPPKLLRILKSGFVKKNGCVFLKDLAIGAHGTLSSFPDRTGFECYVNHFHVDDYVKKDQLAIALKSVNVIANQWYKQDVPGSLAVIVTFDGDSCAVRCHVLRPSESWLADDLEGYTKEGVLVTVISQSSEVPLLAV